MAYMVYNIDVQPFLKACEKFEKFRKNLTTEQEQAGAIQAFEFSYELAWKTMKRLLFIKGIDVRSPRDCFREAALLNMITHPKQWFVFIEKRNLTTHTYNEDIVEEILGIFDEFSSALAELIAYIENERKKSFIS